MNLVLHKTIRGIVLYERMALTVISVGAICTGVVKATLSAAEHLQPQRIERCQPVGPYACSGPYRVQP